MTAKTETSNVATAVATVQVRQGEEGAFAGWLTQLNKTIAAFPGYVSAVVIPPVPPVQSDLVMVQRFQTIEQLRAWLESDARRSLLDEAASLLVDEGTTNVIEGSNTELSPQDMVTEIITVDVKLGMEEAYRAWVDRVRQMEHSQPRLRLVAASDDQRAPVGDARGDRDDRRPVHPVRRRVHPAQLSAKRPLTNSNAEVLAG
jgi:antibiotic biosynthesis monooxygenase (ABM) superfamily enzyme